MKSENSSQTKRKWLRNVVGLLLTASVAGVLVLVFPEKQEPVITTAGDFLLEMIWILPAVMVLLGLFTVWIPQKMVVTYLGKTSGVKGIALAIIFGALPTGPLYVAFPLAAALIRKGARISNVVVFLSAWGCIKLPQEMVELQFLGARFMLARLIFTILFVTLMGWSIEKSLNGSIKLSVPIGQSTQPEKKT